VKDVALEHLTGVSPARIATDRSVLIVLVENRAVANVPRIAPNAALINVRPDLDPPAASTPASVDPPGGSKAPRAQPETVAQTPAPAAAIAQANAALEQ